MTNLPPQTRDSTAISRPWENVGMGSVTNISSQMCVSAAISRPWEDQKAEDQQVEGQQVEDQQVKNQQVRDQQVEDQQVEDPQDDVISVTASISVNIRFDRMTCKNNYNNVK